MKKYLITIVIFGLCFGFAPRVKSAANFVSGDLIKGQSFSAVYFYGADGKRYVFPNEKIFYSWYIDFSSVKTITDAELAAIALGGNATYKPGIKMVKIQTDPKTYAVAGNGILRWVKTEALAVSLYGADWNKKIDDISPVYFTNYTVGEAIGEISDFIPKSESDKYTTINDDKELVAAPEPDKYVWNIQTINDDPYEHKNLHLSKLGGGFLASWHDNRNGQDEIYYQKTDTAGKREGEEKRVSGNISESNYGKGVADGTNLIFLWEDSSAFRRAIYMQRWDLIGNKFSERVFTSTTYATSKYPDFDWSESLGEYGVAWWDTRTSMTGTVGDLYFSRMTDGGMKTGNTQRVTSESSAEFQPKIVVAGENFGILWQESDKKIKFALIDQYSALSGSIKDVYAAGQSSAPRFAWSGQSFGVVWVDESEGGQVIYFMLLDDGGDTVGDKVTVVSGDVKEPAILWSGEKFYVSYTKGNDIYLQKVNLNAAISGAEKNISNIASIKSHSSSLAKNGSLIGIAWLEDINGADKISGAVESEN